MHHALRTRDWHGACFTSHEGGFIRPTERDMGIWTTTAQGLPGEDEAVQFTIRERRVPLRGQYRHGEFATRWWHYPACNVNRWSALEHEPDVASVDAFDAHAAAA